MTQWQPTASLEQLKQNASVVQAIRRYMQADNVLEVSTPAVSQGATTDPNIESLCTSVAGHKRYLHTSPEFPMKRLLAAYHTSIYQLAKVFRDGELGASHNPEFTLLEWYRVGYDHHQLMDDVESLLGYVFSAQGITLKTSRKVSFVDTVAQLLDLKFDDIRMGDIKSFFASANKSFPDSLDDLGSALDLLLDEFVLSSFPTDQLTFLTEYPADQASLARVGVSDNGTAVAERFEAYIGQTELANGFHELKDADEQLRRFTSDNNVRQRRGLPVMPVDHNLIDALSAGLPDCAGVALGIERLMMVLSGATHIRNVLSFGSENA